MRTTLAIEDDAYEVATMYANANGITLGAAVSALVRKAIMPPSEIPSSHLVRATNGLLMWTGGGKAITPEMVKAAQEDEI